MQERLLADIYFYQEGPGVRKWQFKDKGVKLLNGGNINKGIINLDTTNIYIDEDEAYGKYEHFLIDEGDLVIACSGVLVENFHNKIAFIKKEHLPLCLNTSTMRFKQLPSKEGTLDYLKYFLKSNYFKKQIGRLITGSAQLNFGPSHIKQIKIPLPSLEVQKAIAARLDKADEIRQLNQQIINHYDELIQALFIDMFGDPVKNEKGWEKSIIGEVCSKIQIGPFGSQLHQSDYVDNGLPLINPVNIKKDKIDLLNSVKITQEKYDELPNYHLRIHDIILARRGDLSKIGYIKNENNFCGTGSLFIRLKSSLNSFFIFKLLNHISTINYLYKNAQGVTMPNLNKKIVYNIPIFLPPIELQNQFAERVQKIEAQKELAVQALQQSEDLFNSLLQQAFK
jgi:type I restriction enzyme, S subunit